MVLKQTYVPESTEIIIPPAPEYVLRANIEALAKELGTEACSQEAEVIELPAAS